MPCHIRYVGGGKFDRTMGLLRGATPNQEFDEKIGRAARNLREAAPFLRPLAFWPALGHDYVQSKAVFGPTFEASPPYRGGRPEGMSFGERIGLLGGATIAPLLFRGQRSPLSPPPSNRITTDRGHATESARRKSPESSHEAPATVAQDPSPPHCLPLDPAASLPEWRR